MENQSDPIIKPKAKVKKLDLIFFGIILILLIGIVYIISMMKSETTQCLRNPYVYGAKKMGKVQCTCTQDQGQIVPARFGFNETWFGNILPEQGSPFQDNNWADFKLNLSN